MTLKVSGGSEGEAVMSEGSEALGPPDTHPILRSTERRVAQVGLWLTVPAQECLLGGVGRPLLILRWECDSNILSTTC